MSRDRFAELQASQRQFNLQPALEAGPPPPGSGGGSAEMAAFFEEVNALQDAIGRMRDNVNRIEALHARQLQASGPGEGGAEAAELDKLVTQTSKALKVIKGGIQEMEASNEQLSGAAAGDQQMRRTQAAALRRKFLDTAQLYQRVEQTHRQRIRERMERQFRVVNPNATQEEVDAMLAGEANVFAQDVLGTGRKGEARRALQEVQERHEDVRKIERTIMELAQLFQEMATMVEQQGDMLDSIEKSVGNAAAYTEEAVVHLDKAIEHRKSSRKKLWILTCIGAVLLLIAGILIYMYVIRPAMALVPSGGSSGGSDKPEPVASASSRDDDDGSSRRARTQVVKAKPSKSKSEEEGGGDSASSFELW